MSQKRYSEEQKKEMIEWYLAEDERTILDVAWHFSIPDSTVARFIREAGAGKSPHRNNVGSTGPVYDGFGKPSTKSSIPKAASRSSYRGRRRRGGWR